MSAEQQPKHLVLLTKSEDQIQAALGAHGDAKRFVRLAITEFRSNYKLMECSPESFMLALYEGARLGLEIGQQLQQYFLIPRARQVVPMLGYRGMIVLGLRHPDVQTITSTAVFKGDTFEHGENMEGQYFNYKPCGNKKAEELERVFAVCRLKSGGVLFDVMERSEIEAARACSQMPNGGAWKNSYAEMARKTVVRRLFKYMPMVPEAQEAVARDEERWGEILAEVRKPHKYQQALGQAEKSRVVEAEVLEFNSDQSRMGEMHEKLLALGVNIQTVTGLTWPAICALDPGPQLSALADKVAKFLEDRKVQDGKK